MKITSMPTEGDASNTLYELLDVYSAEQGFNTRKLPAEPYLFQLHDNGGTFLGGIQGGITADWLDVYTLYSTRTTKGVGTRLMDHVEQYAREKNCVGVKLVTYEFQAPEFYAKRGYEIYGRVFDVVNRYDIIYMKKLL